MKSFIEANAEESLSFCLIGTINANDAYSKPVMKKKKRNSVSISTKKALETMFHSIGDPNVYK